MPCAVLWRRFVCLCVALHTSLFLTGRTLSFLSPSSLPLSICLVYRGSLCEESPLDSILFNSSASFLPAFSPSFFSSRLHKLSKWFRRDSEPSFDGCAGQYIQCTQCTGFRQSYKGAYWPNTHTLKIKNIKNKNTI